MSKPRITFVTRLGAVLLMAIAIALMPRTGRSGEEIAVPLELQAQLLGKVVRYDRNLAVRSGSLMHVLVVGTVDDPTSMPIARQMRQSLDALDNFGDLPHDVQMLQYAGAADLAEKCKSGSVSLVYFATGFHKDIDAIRSALEPLPILTVTAVPEEVARGMVLGFDLVNGRPKLVVHLTQARKQKVDLSSDVLKLMRVIE